MAYMIFVACFGFDWGPPAVTSWTPEPLPVVVAADGWHVLQTPVINPDGSVTTAIREDPIRLVPVPTYECRGGQCKIKVRATYRR